MGGSAHVVQSLRHILKVQPIINYKISTIGSDGRRIYCEENTMAAGGISKLDQESALQTKI